MTLTRFLLYALLSVAVPDTAFAGEIVLYTRDTCKSFPTIFAAGTTTDCRQADQSVTGPVVYGATTSRNIGASCTFNLYTDKNCKTLAQKLVSSGPAKGCLPVTKGLQSYKITCTDPVSANLVRPRIESDLVLNTYFQPMVTYRSKTSGHTNFAGYNDFCGTHITKKPTGNPSSTGTKLASAMFSQIPTNAAQFTVSVTDGGTQYRVTLGGYKGNNYTAEGTARAMGMAAFASLMADTAYQMSQTPCDYLYYGLANQDQLDEEMGSINMSYVAP